MRGKDLKNILFLLSLLVFLQFFSQPDKKDIARVMDSLQRVYDNSKSDSMRAIVLLNMCDEIYISDPQKAMDLSAKANKLALASGKDWPIGASYGWMAFFAEEFGDPHKAVEYDLLALKYHEKTKDPAEISVVVNNLGSLYHSLGDVEKAISCYDRALKMKRELKDNESVSIIMENLAGIYEENGDIERAEKMHKECTQMLLATGNKYLLAKNYFILGAFYNGQKKYSAEAEYAGKALKLFEELGDKTSIAQLRMAAAIKHSKNGKNDLAEKEYTEAIRLFEELKNKNALCRCLSNYAAFLHNIKNDKQAEQYAKKSMAIGEELGFPVLIERPAFLLRSIYIDAKRYKEALEMSELHVKLRDSISSAKTRKASIRSQLKSEYEKKSAEDSVAFAKESEIKSAELRRQSAELRAKKNQQYALFGGLVLVVVFAGFMFNRFKVTQKQKGIIESQKLEVESKKEEVEEKQREILDSINYARRIQMAQIPSEKRIELMLEKIKK